MKEKKTIYFLAVLLALTSCDPVHTLSVYNASNRNRQLEVVGILRDSVPVQQTETGGKLGQAKLVTVQSKDEIKSSFTFVLPPGQQANLEFGFGTKPATDQIIIDTEDTVVIKKSAGRIKNKPFYAVGGDYVLTLKN